MRTIKMFTFLFMMLAITACFPVTSHGFKKINVNDTEEQVVKVLGRPSTKKTFYSKEHLVYYVHEDFFSVFFNIKRFPFVGFYPLLRTGEEYWVILDDGKVVAFGASKNFANSVPRSLSTSGTFIDKYGE